MLDRVLNAKSVAIIGASTNKNKRGYQAIKTLLADGFESYCKGGQSLNNQIT